MLSFEQAVYEASLFASTNKSRYDMDVILVTETRVVSTDGKRLYIATIEHPPVTGYLKLAYINGGVYKYPRPKQNIKGYTVVSEKDIEMLGTRFDVLKEASFPPYQNIIPDHYDPILLDAPELFCKSIKDLYQYGQKAVKEHLYSTGKKIKTQYRAVLYKNGNLNIVLECSLDKGEYLPISHVQLARLEQKYHPDQVDHPDQDGLQDQVDGLPDQDGLQDQVDGLPDQDGLQDALDHPNQQYQQDGTDQVDHILVVFNPQLYTIKCPPVAIGLKDSTVPVIFQFPGRKLYLMPITGVNDLKDVENFVHWEVYEQEEVIR